MSRDSIYTHRNYQSVSCPRCRHLSRRHPYLHQVRGSRPYPSLTINRRVVLQQVIVMAPPRFARDAAQHHSTPYSLQDQSMPRRQPLAAHEDGTLSRQGRGRTHASNDNMTDEECTMAANPNASVNSFDLILDEALELPPGTKTTQASSDSRRSHVKTLPPHALTGSAPRSARVSPREEELKVMERRRTVSPFPRPPRAPANTDKDDVWFTIDLNSDDAPEIPQNFTGSGSRGRLFWTSVQNESNKETGDYLRSEAQRIADSGKTVEFAEDTMTVKELGAETAATPIEVIEPIMQVTVPPKTADPARMVQSLKGHGAVKAGSAEPPQPPQRHFPWMRGALGNRSESKKDQKGT